MIGIYIIIISFLVLLHIKYIELNGSTGNKIIIDTFNNLMISFKNTNALENAGGGLIGAIFSYIFVTCFGASSKIVVCTLFILGVILILNISIQNTWNRIKPHITNIFEKE